jgi:hypothetical protein
MRIVERPAMRFSNGRAGSGYDNGIGHDLILGSGGSFSVGH